MAYRRKIERDPQRSNGERKPDLSEVIQKLQNPGVVVAFKEDILSLGQKHEIIFLPHAHDIPFNVNPTFEIIEICKNTGISPSIHLSSKFAQAGFDLDDISVKADNTCISGRLANVGPRSFTVPPEYAVPFGFLYAKSHGYQDESSISRHIMQFKKVNKNHNYFTKIEYPDTSEKTSYAMFIEMDTLLHFEHSQSTHSRRNENSIDVSQLYRGTEREKLHRQLKISPVTKQSKPDPHGKEYYSLMESASPISYPKDSGIVIIGGAFLNQNGSVERFFDHGDSVIGQHRDHNKNQKDPAHTLIGEFYMPFQVIQDAKMRGLRVGLVCEPVNLYWATQQGVFIQ